MRLEKRLVIYAFLSGLAAAVAAIFLAVWPTASVGADGGVLYVAPGGDCGGANPCYASVQGAVDAADDGDMIKVAAGIYTGVQGRPVPPDYASPPASGLITQAVYISKSLTIRGGYTTTFAEPPDPEVNPTTLDAEGNGRVLCIAGHISPTVEGLRLGGGDATRLGGDPEGFDVGGGIHVITATAIIKNNRVFNNVAGAGGGLALYFSQATLNGNVVYSNTAESGGGLVLFFSDATLNGNTVSSNTARLAGGGLGLWRSDATLNGNDVFSNTAVERGGGLWLAESGAKLDHNTILSNRADSGGGVWMDFDANTTLNGNTIQGNTGGGGIGIWGSTGVTLGGNTVQGNADGGGVLLFDSADVTLSGNTIRDNMGGSGVYLWSSANAVLNGNTILSNSANYGGGLYLNDSDAMLVNNVVADNRAYIGSGLYVDSSSLRLLHTTLARNNSGDGNGVYVNEFGSNVTLTNTILVSHTVGVYVASGNTIRLEGTLWGNGTWANAADWGGDGTVITGTVNFWENPAFTCTGTLCVAPYHIGPGSAALDRGVNAGVRMDVDYEPRPYQAPDLGADEYWPPGALKKFLLPLVVRSASS